MRRGAAIAVLTALRLYKTLLSPLFAGSCRYLPSCSDYMAEAVERHGAAAGTALGLCRLCRCHPLGGSGFDPVPERRPWRALVARRSHEQPADGPGRASPTDMSPGISA
ncbi:MAG: membrane protein insertion efficiency factor YidD [Vicinamibacterales bacterium]|nr:membrane protein insertion efficiency factor YidD [Vicinamibacterales bacterium]